MEHTEEGMKESARQLCQLGCKAVLVKGGHVDDDTVDHV